MRDLKCENCGFAIDEETVFCPNCGAKIDKQKSTKSTVNINNKELNDSIKLLKGAVTEAVNNVNESAQKKIIQITTGSYAKSPELVLSEDEVVIKTYHCAAIKRQFCNGYLTVTNKRVIFNGVSSKSRIEKEVTLESISGIDTYYGMNVSITKLIFGIILSFFGLSTMDDNGAKLIGLIFLMLGILLIYLAIKRTYILALYSSKASLSPINIGAGPASTLGNGAIMSLQANPTSETDAMMKEVGALILDVQTLGDYAIEKWKK